MNVLKLDVGCGNRPEGDVNCDLYITDVGHRTAKRNSLSVDRSRSDFHIDFKQVPNFVLCDAMHLPFRTGCFDEVVSNSVIEHISEPQMFLKELLRVSSFQVTILCPHRLGEAISGGLHNRFHLQHLNISWFSKVAKIYGCMVKAEIRRYRYLPFDFFPLFRFPRDLTVTLSKRDKYGRRPSL